MNKKETFYTVYQTLNKVNQNVYIGVHKTTDPYDGYLGSGIILCQAIEKYGRENFEKTVLFIFEKIEDAYRKENELVNQEFVSRVDTYNLAIGGSISPDHIKGRKYPVKEEHHQWGKKTSQESNEKRRKTLSITNAQPETHQNRSIGGIKAYESRKKEGYINPILEKGRKLSDVDKKRKSVAAKNREKVTCPYCSGRMDPGNAKRFHFDKCKFRALTES